MSKALTLNLSAQIQIGNPNYGLSLITLLATVTVLVIGLVWRYRAARRFADSSQLEPLFPSGVNRRAGWQAGLSLLAMFFLLASAMDLRWGKVSREVPQRGVEVMFALDVSRSMLAEDVTPNRLSRAKQMIKDTVEAMPGDAVGLVIFAGEARQAIPITNHHDDFRQKLDQLGPDDLRRGGSRLGDAIDVAKGGFLTESASSHAIVLLTDGEDMESSPVEAAKAAKTETDVVIYTIGLGDVATGARIPQDSGRNVIGQGQYIEHAGEQVWSKLDGSVLTQIAEVTGGAYLPAGTKQVDMAAFHNRYLSKLTQTETEIRTVDNYEARYQWFLAPAIAFLVASLLPSLSVLSGSRSAEKPTPSPPDNDRGI